MICESDDSNNDSRWRSLVPIYHFSTVLDLSTQKSGGMMLKRLTSGPCCGSYDDIDVSLVRMLVSPRRLDRSVDRCCDSVSSILERGGAIRSREAA